MENTPNKEIIIETESSETVKSYARDFYRGDLERMEMDAVLAYKNLLALEDHILENINQAVGQNRIDLEEILAYTRSLRTRVMPAEVNPEFHCMAKHASAALMAVEELHKAAYTSSKDPDTNIVFDDMLWEAQKVLAMILERLWGHQLDICKRCK